MMRSAATSVSSLPVAVGTLQQDARHAVSGAMPDHLGRNRRLVDEDEARRISLDWLDLQLGTRRSDIRTILFGGVQVFFECDVVAS